MSRSEPPAPLLLDGNSLTLADVVAVARQRRPVALSPAAASRVARCRVVVDLLLDHGQKVYGLTTGFGRLRDVMIDRADTAALQSNLIRSHACGVGRPFPEDVVRAALLLRINTLAKGHSGVRVLVIETLIQMLNEGVFPHVPEQGSVGASGDLAPLSHLALVLIGDPDGRMFDPLRRQRGEPFVADPREADFVPVKPVGRFRPLALQAKEGLALNNGTQFMAALLCLAIADGTALAHSAELACALSHEAQKAVTFGLSDPVHAVRDLPHQMAVARRVRAHLEGSEIVDTQLNTAWLRRARRQLDDALTVLARGNAIALATRVHRLRADVDAWLTDHKKILERRAQDDAAGGDALETDFRRQLRVFGLALHPLRRDAAVCYQEAQAAATTEELRKAASALAAALHSLDAAVPAAPPVQEDYSFRCFPQVAACAWRALEHAESILKVEINAATDNPLLFPPEAPGDLDVAAYRTWLETPGTGRLRACVESVVGGGNFHGEPLAVTADCLAIAMAELGSIAERRVSHLVDESTSNGLPPFLIEGVGLNSGFMIPQYTAAALVSENKVLCHPASVDSIPTSANAEDHVSMGTHAARKCRTVIEHVAQVVAIEFLTAQQAVQFRAPLRLGRGTQAACQALLDAGVEPKADQDRVLAVDMRRALELVRGGRLRGG